MNQGFKIRFSLPLDFVYHTDSLSSRFSLFPDSVRLNTGMQRTITNRTRTRNLGTRSNLPLVRRFLYEAQASVYLHLCCGVVVVTVFFVNNVRGLACVCLCVCVSRDNNHACNGLFVGEINRIDKETTG